MTAGGRTHDADAFWIHLPFLGAGANESQGTRGLYFYVIMRTISFRRMRVPKPQVNVGDKI